LGTRGNMVNKDGKSLLVMNRSKKLKTRCDFSFRMLRLDDRADDSDVDVFRADVVR
jgi:hypothetical protein